jgi:hypothetical protein
MARTNRLLSPLLGALLIWGACSDDSTPPVADKAGTGDAGVCDDSKTCSTTGLLPADNKVGDYQKKSAPRVAVNGACLQQLINGGSVKYEQNKFTCVSVVTYASATAATEVEVWAFDQTDQAGAQAAMDLAAQNLTELAPTIGDASKEDATLPGTYLAFARKGKTLVRVLASKKTGRDGALSLLGEVIAAAP